MSKRFKTGLILAGAACALLLAAASWYAVACQEGRLVYPMDFSACRRCCSGLSGGTGAVPSGLPGH